MNNNGSSCIGESALKQSESVVDDDPFVQHIKRNEQQSEDDILMHLDPSKNGTGCNQQAGCAKLSKNEQFHLSPGTLTMDQAAAYHVDGYCHTDQQKSSSKR